MIRKWYRVLHRFFAALTLVLGVFVIFSCVLTLTHIVGEQMNLQNTTTTKAFQTDVKTERANETEIDNATVTTQNTPPTSTEVTEAKTPSTSESEEYKSILTICVGLGLGAGIVQFFSSLYSCFANTKESGYKIKIWIVIQSLIIALLIVCVLLPWGFSKHDGKLHTPKEFASTAHKTAGQFFHKGSDETIIDHLKNELRLYYLALISNIVLVAFISMLTCCCLGCGTYEYEVINDKFELY